MAKKLVSVIKLELQAGKASPAPPVGSTLGQHGVNIMSFCKEYNAATVDKGELIIPVQINVYQDKSYSLLFKTPPVAKLLCSSAGINKGSSTSKKGSVGTITIDQLEDIAKIKLPDLNTKEVCPAMRIVLGTAVNMGIQIIN